MNNEVSNFATNNEEAPLGQLHSIEEGMADLQTLEQGLQDQINDNLLTLSGLSTSLSRPEIS